MLDDLRSATTIGLYVKTRDPRAYSRRQTVGSDLHCFCQRHLEEIDGSSTGSGGDVDLGVRAGPDIMAVGPANGRACR